MRCPRCKELTYKELACNYKITVNTEVSDGTECKNDVRYFLEKDKNS
jgi:transcriptional antiterminator Rof (Rho-off)